MRHCGNPRLNIQELRAEEQLAQDLGERLEAAQQQRAMRQRAEQQRQRAQLREQQFQQRMLPPEIELQQAASVGAAAQSSGPGGMSFSKQHQLVQQQPQSLHCLGGMRRSQEHHLVQQQPQSPHCLGE